MPKISIIVPIYNTAHYLKKCLNSLLAQEISDLEILLINDGSPDNSQEIIDSYKERYPDKIKVFVQENQGQAAARNFGIENAKGEYLAFVDSDDYIEPHAYSTAIDYAQKNGLDIVCFDFWEINENGSRQHCSHCVFEGDGNKTKYILNETSPCNKIIKREIFAKNALRFTANRIYEDLELIPQLALYTDNIGFLDVPLYNYVIHSGSTMRQASYSSKLASIFSVMERLYEVFSETAYYQELEYLYIEHLLHSSTLRYLQYAEGVGDIKRIAKIMRDRFPNWRKNQYYKQMNIKYKIFCELAYHKQIKLLKAIMR